MHQVAEAQLPIVNRNHQPLGTAVIRCLPRRTGGLWITEDPPFSLSPVEQVQVEEGREYRYFIEIDEPGNVTTDRADLFIADDDNGRSGRLRTRLHVGGLPVGVFLEDVFLGTFSLEVRSIKLNYEKHFNWMLRDIAKIASESVMNRFAPTEQWFNADPSRDTELLFQRFLIVKSIVCSQEFEAAIAEIASRPHRVWESVDHERPIAMGINKGSRLVRDLAKPGQRQPWLGSPHPNVPSLPRTVHLQRQRETVDTPENRFVKHAIRFWYDIAIAVREALGRSKATYSVVRGIREAEEVIAYLTAILSQRLFSEVGDMLRFPGASVTLAQKPAYREVYSAFLLSQSAGSLLWSGAEDVYGAGQRDVATLYEYWVYLQLVSIVSDMGIVALEKQSLFEITRDGLSLNLRRGEGAVVRGKAKELGREINVELYFNRLFSPPARRDESESWSRGMQPDCSFHAFVEQAREPSGYHDVWIHFDAKYRINSLADLFGGNASDSEIKQSQVEGAWEDQQRDAYVRDDLVKMHAYKDAIRRSAGANIVYPGTDAEYFREYKEILPGLGAFPLKPSDSDGAQGKQSIRGFLEAVISHLANETTEHERARYWAQQSFCSNTHSDVAFVAIDDLPKPPADIRLALAFPFSKELYSRITHSGMLIVPCLRSGDKVPITVQDLSLDMVALDNGTSIELWPTAGEITIVSGSELDGLQWPDEVPKFGLGFHIIGDPVSRISRQGISSASIASGHLKWMNQLPHGVDLFTGTLLELYRTAASAPLSR